MPRCHNATMSPCQDATMPPCMPPCRHATTMPPCHHAAMPLPCHHASMPPCRHATMPPFLHANMPPCQDATREVLWPLIAREMSPNFLMRPFTVSRVTDLLSTYNILQG